MLDRYTVPLIRPAADSIAQGLARLGVGANSMTVFGFALGLVGAALIAAQAYPAGLALLLCSRTCDALDGAIARQTQTTDAGGFLDITLDFLFYASIPLAFAFARPEANALAAATLLAAFIGTGSSFLAFAALAAKRGLADLNTPGKSIYFLGGLTEATETLLCFVAMCLWPEHFAVLAYGFAALCALTTMTRIAWGWRTFS
jgi:phosphatidylglycerophosphate synthase